MQKIISLMLLFNIALLAKAQDLYVTANASTERSLAENMRPADLVPDVPGFNVAIGYNPFRFGGLRLSVGYNHQNGRAPKALGAEYPDLNEKYRFNTITGYLDAMVNLTNCFSEKKSYRRNALYLVLGGGALYTSNFSPFLNDEVWHNNYCVNTKSRIVPVVHAGLAGSIKLTNHLDLALEAKYNLASDRYNGWSRNTSRVDGFVDVNIGLSWFFFRKRSAKPAEKIVLAETVVPKMEDVETIAKSNEFLETDLSFVYGSSELQASQKNNLRIVADYLFDNPKHSIVLHSYGEKEGNDAATVEYNKQIATERAQTVRDRLVNTYNVAESRILVEIHPNILTKTTSQKVKQGEITAMNFEIVK